MNLLSYLPLFVVIFSNVIYHNVTKHTPADANPFLSLGITYFVAMAASLLLYFTASEHHSLFAELQKLNWSSYLLGLAIIGLEAGYIYTYRAGWEISRASLIANITLAVILLVIGIFFYQEILTLKQLLGVLCCIAGIFLLK
jgi:drug/metabolite transporter (DMT)-like permease